MTRPDPETLAARVRAGDRRALARAITLVESTRRDDRAAAQALLAALLPVTGGAVRLGLSGVPGVGKSTFIESFGLFLLDQGHRLAVLAVDPSSTRSGGAILGDKTRMPDLARRREAFVRPSPTGGTLGGVARRTREALLLCEAAGFDVVMVETVGVGQSETVVADMVDMFLLLLLPGGGDELQGIKKGIAEIADLLVVNKADSGFEAAARTAAADYRAALRMVRPASGWQPPVLTCSALDGRGLEAIWTEIERYRAAMRETGDLARRRAAQARSWMWQEVEAGLRAAFHADPGVGARLPALEAAVAEGRMAPTAAAEALLAAFLPDRPAPDGGGT